MRAIIILLVVLVLVAIVAVATGFVNLSGRSGSMPTVAVSGGKMPSVNADVGSIAVGSKSTTVDVPKVETKKETISVPVIGVKKAGEK